MWVRVYKVLCCRKERSIVSDQKRIEDKWEVFLYCVYGGEYVYVCCGVLFVCILLVQGGERGSFFGRKSFW